MKNLGQIQIGGSLDITTNKHVEDLIEEAIEGLDIPEDTNTTYTLTQDGLTVQLVDDQNSVVSEIALPEVEDTVYTLRILEGNRGRHTLDLVDADGMMVSRVNFTIPNDTNTTYTLRRDGDTRIEIIGNDGHVSGVDIASLLPEEKDPYQEVKGIPLPPANLLNMLRSEDYSAFDLTSEFDAENNLISIYLHLYEKGIERKFTLADEVDNRWTILNKRGENTKEIYITKVSSTVEDVTIEGTDSDGADDEVRLFEPKVQNARDSDMEVSRYGIVISNAWGNEYFYIPGDPFIIESEPTVITATIEEHLQSIYGFIHNS